MQSNQRYMETVTKKRSESLTRSELKALKKYRVSFSTEVACAATIGIDRNVLNRVVLAGSGAPETIAKIRAVLKTA